MLPFDLSQYSVTARNDLCMALYRMTERHNPRPESNPAEIPVTKLKGGDTNEQD